MKVTSNIRELVRAAMAKQAMDTGAGRNAEHEKDVQEMVPSSVDSHTASGATGILAANPVLSIGTTAEGSTDVDVEGLPADQNDDQAFKSASQLRRAAKGLLGAIKSAAEDALSVDAAEGGTSNTPIPEDEGASKPMTLGPQDGAAPQADTSAIQTGPTKTETKSAGYIPGQLASTLYKMANNMELVNDRGFCKAAGIDEQDLEEPLTEDDIDSLPDEEADEVAAALEAAAMEAAAEGTEDADSVSDYLGGYLEGAIDPGAAPEEEVDAGLAAAAEAELAGGGGDEIDQLATLLEEAGITPEELVEATAKQASADKNAWSGLNKAARRKVVLSALSGLNGGR